MSRAIYVLLFIIIGIGGIIYLSHALISSGAFPSLGEFIASSTPAIASSTPITSSSTTDFASSTTVLAVSTTTTAISTTTNAATTSPLRIISIKTANTTIKAYAADDQTTQEKGLGDRESLPMNEGMLFVFSTSQIYKFWMKDMLFSLDMIWIDENKQVIDITDNISPDTFPSSFQSSSPVKYVLEVNAGFAEKNNIKVGDNLIF